MNPALPVLALLTAGGAFLRRRELGAPWAVLGLAGIALLAPALALPTGVPSPAATLANLPPWQGTGTPAGNPLGNPTLRDVTFQIQPWLLYLRHELRAGRLPFWNPHQSSGAPFWANGQSAPLFPLHLLFAALPVGLGLVLLPWLRLVIGGCGAWVLAREIGIGRPAALLTALTFPLAGMTVSFLLFPMGNALALMPWVLWAVERIAMGTPRPHGVLALGVAGGLQLLAGHPETAAHTALLSVVYLAVRNPWRWSFGFLRPWLGLVGGWTLAALAAGIEILPVAYALPLTSRWQLHLAGPEPALGLLARQPLRLVLPQLYGHPAAGTWWGPFNYSATAVYAGALALPFAAAGLMGARSDRRLRAVAAVLAFSFLAAYHLPGLRDLLGALPLVGRAPLHRLISGIELGLALLAGAGLDRWLAGRGRGVLAGGGAVAVLLAAAWALFAGDWAAHGLLREEAIWTAVAAAVAALLALSLRLPPERRSTLGLLISAFALCDLIAAHGAINPGLPLARLYPETGAVRFLAGRSERAEQLERVAGTGEALRPNGAMVYGLADPRGDDPVKIARYEAVYGSFATPDPVYFQPISRWSDPWLDRLGVRWVLAGPSEPPPVPGWRMAYGGPDARVYERSGALPLVRWERGGEGSALHVVQRRPGLWEIDWRTPRPDRLVVAETAVPGWRAAANGRESPVDIVDGLLLGIPLGPGSGRVAWTYRPPGFAAGALASAVGVAGMLVLAAGGLRRRRESSA